MRLVIPERSNKSDRESREAGAALSRRSSSVSRDASDPFDAFGLDLRYYDRWMRLAKVYFRWLRVTVDGLNNIPPEGGAILAGNHAGHRWHDTTALQYSVRCVHPEARIVRPLIFNGLAKFLVAGHVITQYAGAVVGHPRNVDYLVERGDLVLVYPEGSNATIKPFRDRNQVCPAEQWGTGFIRAAMRTQAPIIPVVAYGFESTVPTLWLSRRLGRFWGMPKGVYPVSPQTFVTWTIPMNGGAFPFPMRCHISILPPINVEELLGTDSNWSEQDVQLAAETVRSVIATRLDELRRKRQSSWRRIWSIARTRRRHGP